MTGDIRPTRRALGLGIGAALLTRASRAEIGAPYFTEAPEFAARVARGELPPVEERVPRNPVLTPMETRLGRYGGVWRQAFVGEADAVMIYRSIGYENLVRWDPAWNRVVPNVAQTFAVSDDARVVSFHLRAGLRWSDGVPFTSEDVRFWFDHVIRDPELVPEPPEWLTGDRLDARLVVEGPLAFRFVFAAPNSLFPAAIASGQDTLGPTECPAHHLARLHGELRPEADAEARATGWKGWAERFRAAAGLPRSRSDIGALLRIREPRKDVIESARTVPTLNAWIVVRREPGDPPRYVAVRNPYYFKIDPAGAQLPYIDRVEFMETRSLDEVAGLLKAGRLGMQTRHVSNPTLRDEANEAIRSGGYRPVTLLPSVSNVLALAFNQTHVDPRTRSILRVHDLRVALSLAIDRRALIDQVFLGRGEPSQMAPRPESHHYHPRLAEQYLDHDPARAAEILDHAGLRRPAPGGPRLCRGGDPIVLTVTIRDDHAQQAEAIGPISEAWRDLGIGVRVLRLSRRDLDRAVENNDFEIAPATIDGGLDPILEIHPYIPIRRKSVFAPLWWRWVINPADPLAEEPPDSVKRQLALHGEILATASPREQARLIAEILDIAAGQFFVIGVAAEAPQIGVVPRGFLNVPRMMPNSWLYPTPGPTNPPQYFIETG